MPKVSEQYLEARREQILRAAFTCFCRSGFHATTIREICDEAELSPGAVYRYFEGKQAIIQAIGEWSSERRAPAIDAAMSMDDAPAALEMLIELYFATITDETAADSVRFDIDLWAEALRNAELREILLGPGYWEVPALLTRLIERGQERQQIAPDWDAQQVSRTLAALFNGIELQVALAPSTDARAMASTVVALFAQLARDPAGSRSS